MALEVALADAEGNLSAAAAGLRATSDEARVVRERHAQANRTWRDANGVPIMEDEFGWPNNTNPFDSCFNQSTVAFDEANNIPWLGYHFVGWSERFNAAVHPDGHDYTPTISGQPFKDGLANNQN